MKDYTFCKGTGCKKKSDCRRFLGNYILEFVPMKFIECATCINTKFSMFDEKGK